MRKKTESITDPDMPHFEWTGKSCTLTGHAKPEFAPDAWSPFIEDLQLVFQNMQKERRSEFIINFKLEFYNSSSNIYISKFFALMQEYSHKCKMKVNWYYFEKDDDGLADGEMYRDSKNFSKVETILIARNE